MSFTISASAFSNTSSIPKKFTCDGPDLSRQLSWAEAPDTTKSVALLVDDPDGTEQGKNDFGKTGYNGPCPPAGKPHRYYFRLFALDITLDLKAGSRKKELETAMKGHVLGQAEWMGTYRR